MARLITQAQFARRSGYSPARITQLVKEGVITLTKGKIDAAQAEAAIEANIDRSRQLKSQAKSQAANGHAREAESQAPKSAQMELPIEGGNGKDHTTPSLTDARRDHELLKMKLTEAQLEQRLGELVPKGEATKWLIALGSATKLAFLNLPRRLAGTLKALDDEKEIEILLRSEIRSIIYNLLEKPLRGKHKRTRKKNSKKRVGGHLEASRRDHHPGVG
jgi:hypothetical protein